MKRIGYLYDDVMDIENIAEAMRVYNRNRPVKNRVRVSYVRAVKLLERMREDYAKVIGRPKIHHIIESGKDRKLQVPSYDSCIAQIALWNVCGKYVEKRIHTQSFSSRKGMGGHLAARKCERFVHTHIDGEASYHLYFDVRKYYQHIDPRILKDRLATIFKDQRILDMFAAVIDSAEEGLPIGYPFSHALANLYLVPLYYLLRSMKGVTKIFVYMDNWTVFSRYKKPLHRARQAAARWLDGMGCTIKDDWQIAPTRKRGVHLCGFIIGAHRTRLYRNIWHRIMHNVDLFKAHPDVHLQASLMSRHGWLKAVRVQFYSIFRIGKGGGYLWQ